MNTLIDTPWSVMLSPTKKNINKWLDYLRNLDESKEVKAEIKRFEKELKLLQN